MSIIHPAKGQKSIFEKAGELVQLHQWVQQGIIPLTLLKEYKQENNIKDDLPGIQVKPLESAFLPGGGGCRIPSRPESPFNFFKK
jgi:hypothetical protein